MTITVIDTSVWISAIRYNGKSRSVVLALLFDGVVAYSGAIYYEVVDVLRRLSDQPEIDEETFQTLLLDARRVEPKQEVVECRDRHDNIFLECALEAKADLILSSDNDLLSMNPWRGIRIYNPGRLMEIALKQSAGRR